MNQKYLYSFEAKEIQKFILQGDKLKEMIGGSEIVSRLCDEFLKKTLKELGGEHEIIANAAGWGRIIFHSKNGLEQFYAHWPMLAAQFAPGLQVIQAVVELPDENNLLGAIDEINRLLRLERNVIIPLLPEITPLVDRNLRTGLAAVIRHAKDDGLLDRQAVRKRSYEGQSLTISRQLNTDGLTWPEDFERIVDEESSFLAIIHADGNDLGSTLIRIKEHIESSSSDPKEIYGKFSEVIDQSTVGATQYAFDKVLKPAANARKDNNKGVIPGRPIVLGGDDLTIIVRADLAFDFIVDFLQEFESQSEKKIKELLGEKGLPQKLTACAGIAFVKKNYPFVHGYELAESICGYTKQQAKQNKFTIAKDPSNTEYIPSSFAFHKNTSSIAGDYGEVCHRELTSRNREIKLWSGPYAVSDSCESLLTFSKLKELSTSLCKLPGGSVRELIADLHIDGELAKKRFNRMLQVADEDAKSQLTAALKGVGINEGVVTDTKHTALLDAHTMNSLTGKREEDNNDNG